MKWNFLFNLFILSYINAYASNDDQEKTATKATIDCAKRVMVSEKFKFVPYQLQDSYEITSTTSLIYTFDTSKQDVTRMDNGFIPDSYLVLPPNKRWVTRDSWTSRIESILPALEQLTLRNFEYTADLPRDYTTQTARNLGQLPDSIKDLTVEFSELGPNSPSPLQMRSKFEQAIRVLCAVCPQNIESLTIIYNCPKNERFHFISSGLSNDPWFRYFPKSMTSLKVNTEDFDYLRFHLLTERLERRKLQHITINGRDHLKTKLFDLVIFQESLTPQEILFDETYSDSTETDPTPLLQTVSAPAEAITVLNLDDLPSDSDSEDAQDTIPTLSPMEHGTHVKTVKRSVSWDAVRAKRTRELSLSQNGSKSIAEENQNKSRLRARRNAILETDIPDFSDITHDKKKSTKLKQNKPGLRARRNAILETDIPDFSDTIHDKKKSTKLKQNKPGLRARRNAILETDIPDFSDTINYKKKSTKRKHGKVAPEHLAPKDSQKNANCTIL